MSLKTFHVVFVTLCIIFTVGFGIWEIRDHPVLGVTSFVLSIVLIWYGVWFLRKLKGVSYL